MDHLRLKDLEKATTPMDRLSAAIAVLALTVALLFAPRAGILPWSGNLGAPVNQAAGVLDENRAEGWSDFVTNGAQRVLSIIGAGWRISR